MVRTQHLLVVTVVVLYCMVFQPGVEGITKAGDWFRVRIKCRKCAVNRHSSKKVRIIREKIKRMEMMAKMLKVLLPHQKSSHTKKNRFRVHRLG